ncbi:hypothetical protein HPB47_015294 [Ixodes persulcatus]|uniref:Uncharacterized protein n=1 Tax=Ixodes persulcatus TaxID=34615 RepID=A0AC60QTU8_IXOPE|nr:hypothetical protein HPB47_015294 [Ixodes persulcatus]
MPVSHIQRFSPKSVDDLPPATVKAYWVKPDGGEEGFYDAHVLHLGNLEHSETESSDDELVPKSQLRKAQRKIRSLEDELERERKVNRRLTNGLLQEIDLVEHQGGSCLQPASSREEAAAMPRVMGDAAPGQRTLHAANDSSVEAAPVVAATLPRMLAAQLRMRAVPMQTAAILTRMLAVWMRMLAIPMEVLATPTKLLAALKKTRVPLSKMLAALMSRNF